MANKQALRDLQTRLAERLRTAKTQQRGRSWLAVECGTHGFLLPLGEAGEIFALAPILPVPHTHRWFQGVVNLRGRLHGVVDLAGFLGLQTAASGREQARLVGFNASLDLNCTLLVDRLCGLRNDDVLTPLPASDAPKPAFVGQRLRDADGKVWLELKLTELAADEAFLKIVE